MVIFVFWCVRVRLTPGVERLALGTLLLALGAGA